MTAPIHKRVSQSSNSWYLKTGTIHHYLCRCGQVDQINGGIVSLEYHPDHCCSACGRSHYLDSHKFVYESKVKYWSEFNWEYEHYSDTAGWHINAVAKIPLFDFHLQKIVRMKIVMATYSLRYDGKLNYDRHTTPDILKKKLYNGEASYFDLAERILSELKDKLYPFVLKHPTLQTAWLIDEKRLDGYSISEGFEIIGFFLHYPHLKTFDYFYWKNFKGSVAEKSKEYPTVEKLLHIIMDGRKERSVKRACFKAYQYAMAIEAYDPMADYIFARAIRDPNHLVKLLSIDPLVKHQLFEGIAPSKIFNFFDLLQAHYSDRTIIALWLSIDRGVLHRETLRDTIRMLSGERMRDLVAEHFIKPSPTIEALHDELIRLNNLFKRSIKHKVAFDYDPRAEKAQTTIENFSFVLPKNTDILNQWAQKLHNCMFSYATSIHRGESIIYAVFVDDVLSYAIEIHRAKIVQALGRFNKRIDKEDRAVIEEWFREVYIRGMIGKL